MWSDILFITYILKLQVEAENGVVAEQSACMVAINHQFKKGGKMKMTHQ